MRHLRAVAALSLASVIVGSPTSTHSAGREGARIGVSVSLSGFANPSQFLEDPCDDSDFPDYWVGETTTEILRDSSLEITNAQLDYEPARGAIEASYGPDVVEHVVWTDKMYLNYCWNADTLDVDASTQDFFWVPLVTQQTVVPALFAHVWDYAFGPVVSWPSMDREFGWLYVRAPMDFRVDPIETIDLTATVSNVTGTVTARVVVTPETITLEPGEPGGLPVSCPLSAATDLYLVESPGWCSYTYENSSAISPSLTFDVGAMASWGVATSDPTFPVNSIRTWSWDDVAVAEAQAVVTG